MTDLAEPQWLTRIAYAIKYGVCRRTVWKWLDAGVLETYRVDKILRIRDLPPDQHRPRCTAVHSDTQPPSLGGSS